MKLIYWFFKSIVQWKKGYCIVSFEDDDIYLCGFMSRNRWEEVKKIFVSQAQEEK